MPLCKRFGKRWTINECLQLQREFELLQLPIDEIATKHQRTANAIMSKLDQEGLADYNILYSEYHKLNSSSIIQPMQSLAINHCTEEHNCSESEDDSHDHTNLRNHVLRLEKQMHSLTALIMKQPKGKSSILSL